MKITKTVAAVFLLTFFIGSISIYFLRNYFAATERKSEIEKYGSVEPIAVLKDVQDKVVESTIISYATAKNFGGAELLDEYYDWTEEEKKYEYKMLRTGEFHGDEIDAKTGEQWLGLFRDKDEFVLRDEKITVRRVRDEIVDDKPKEKTGKSVAVESKSEPLFLLKDAGKFKRGKIETFFKGVTFDEADESQISTTELKSGFAQTYKIGDREYALRGEKIFNKKSEIVFALVLESGKAKQILHVSGEDYLGGLFWVGDFDRDGKPDFFLAPWVKENITESSLFLSSEAEKNNLVRKIALMTTVGC